MRFYQCFEFLTKTVFRNILHKSSEKTVMKFYFSEVAACDLTKKRALLQFLLAALCEIFWTNFFIEHLRANASVPLRSLRDLLAF